MNSFDTANLEENVSAEDLGRAGFVCLQQKNGFRFGTDSVLLAWFAASLVRSNKATALELGSNCGACSLCFLARRPKATTDCVELMPSAYELLCENRVRNKLEDRLNPILADIRQLPSEIRNKHYDVVFFNPPFFNRETGITTSKEKATEVFNARFEENGSLEDFCSVASSRVYPSRGYAVMVMKGNRLNDALSAFSKSKLIPTKLLTIHSFNDKNACMFLLAGKRDAKNTQLEILPPLILNERAEDSSVNTTKRLLRIYEEEHTDCFI